MRAGKPLLTLPTPQGMTIGAPLAAVLLPGDAGAPKVLCVGSDNETALYYPYGSGLWGPGPLRPSPMMWSWAQAVPRASSRREGCSF